MKDDLEVKQEKHLKSQRLLSLMAAANLAFAASSSLAAVASGDDGEPTISGDAAVQVIETAGAGSDFNDGCCNNGSCNCTK